MAVGSRGLTVSFHRINRSTILAVFQNLTQSQVNTVIANVKQQYPTFEDDDSSYQNFTVINVKATSVADGVSGNGYYIVQLDKKGVPIPWGMTEYIKSQVNSLATS